MEGGGDDVGNTTQQHPIPMAAGSRRLPNLLQSVNLKHVKLGYHYLITHFLTLLLIPFMALILVKASQTNPDDVLELWTHLTQYDSVGVLVCSAALVFVSTVYFRSRPRPVYLVDFACFRAPDELRVPMSKFLECSRRAGDFDESALEFQRKILERSGMGDETRAPAPMHSLSRWSPSVGMAREESELAMFGAVDALFKNMNSARVKPKDIGVLVVSCSTFSPTPSLSAMIVNRYKLRGNVKSFNLGGMGCSAGVIAVDLARDILQVHGGTYALVVSTENITQNWYFGNKKSMLITNCLFRMGAAAVLLSNKPSDRARSKYKLVHVVRTHRGADDRAFRCIKQEEDETGMAGFSLPRDLMTIAGDALKTNITTLGPLVLHYQREAPLLRQPRRQKDNKLQINQALYPRFQAGVRALLHPRWGKSRDRRGGEEPPASPRRRGSLVEASRMTLHRFGNVSASSIWYEVAYIESKGRMRKGDRVWQIALGSGFKCNSAVWVAVRDVEPSPGSAWKDCITRYPAQLPP
ncbi:hypothetical protein H6P81_014779 [Aristolochia fimbriata]|uniref:3-ketoacyl-CoA synthase n=1 Tax=Aristolochia fimbriata TaxID=158543 RepID=A0AAV7E5F5_ARIFI|nr:hypothetical protein H6P81_014779 [Aristolochia fimbriata]